jgi:acyl-CoA oxidase
MLGTLVQGRVSVGGAAISASKVALSVAIKYGLIRRQFGSPGTDREEVLLDYGMHQRRLLPLLARTYALHFAQERVAADLHEVFSNPDASEHDRRALESRAAGTKALGTWHASRAIQEGREACGGAGYLLVNRFGALRADTDVFTTFEGDNTILLQLVAKGLLTNYADEFGDLDQFGMMRFVASVAVETVIERTSVHKLLDRMRDVLPPGDNDGDPDSGLLDSSYHLNLLRWREEHMLAGVARRLKKGMDDGGDPAMVFSMVQDHVIASANAHVERLLLEAFLDKVESMPDGQNKVAMQLVCDLFALSTIEADRAWFMEHGRFSNARSKAVTAMVNELCRRLRPIADQLVDAFDIPQEMLRAEIIQPAY